ncbi:FadR family transcriptional regulator [Aquiluna borgnonia]|uniref:FadR family transcriptional regulator n=1 Tax=Aquiluna borgnonia TaxID=2499157 RepID=A0A7D4UK63_9MICO|nr:GntR family transcriptional regulator [Aquiluna borgnonia]QKJ25619.1 FadR family transcriptional regulator [Aquiluna borgnonia]
MPEGFEELALDESGGRASLLLTRIRSGNVYEETIERILQTIKLGVAVPGERLPAERYLANLLGVSRDTVRDAIASLVEAGYLQIRRGRYGGTFVSEQLPIQAPGRPTFVHSELEDTLLFREVVECGAAYQAARSELTAEQRRSLWQAHTETSAADSTQYRRLDSRFHLLLAELSGSSKLVTEVAYSRMRMNELLDQIPLLAPNIHHSNEQHEAIIHAVLAADPNAASEAMRSHLSGSAALLRGFLA